MFRLQVYKAPGRPLPSIRQHVSSDKVDITVLCGIVYHNTVYGIYDICKQCLLVTVCLRLGLTTSCIV